MTTSDQIELPTLNTHTIYLDENPFFVRLAFLLMGIWFAAQGISGFYHHTGSLPWLHRLQLLTGIFGIVRVIHNIYYVKKYGRNRITLNSEDLEYKIKQYESMNSIPWQDISRINLKSNAIEIMLKLKNTNPLKLKLRQFPLLRSSRINDEIKDHFKEFVSERNIEIIF